MTVHVLLALLVAQGAPKVTLESAKEAAAYSADARGFSFLAMVDGKVLHEEYPNGGSATRATELASGTKSFCGVMALAAQEDGLLKLDEKVSDTMTEWKSDERKDITIRHLLTLSSGLPGGTSALAGGRVPAYKDTVKWELRNEVGKSFSYGPYPFQIFGEVMRRKLKDTNVLAYLEKRVFKPIGLEHGFWRTDRDGNPHLPSGASLTAREWAKFGEMVRLNGKGVLKSGVADLWKPGANRGYGLTWWLPTKGGMGAAVARPRLTGAPEDVWMAAGAGGQRLYVVPSLKLVVVRQAPVLSGERTFNDGRFMRLLLAGKS